MQPSLATSKPLALASLTLLASCTQPQHNQQATPSAPLPLISAQPAIPPTPPTQPTPATAPISQAHVNALQQPSPPTSLPATITEPIPPAAYQLRFRLIPASPDGSIQPFYISQTEIPWDVADIYIFKLDVTNASETGSAQASANPAPNTTADAITRPSKPYLPPDRGFGHEGYAAITMSFHNAKEFCAWLTKRSKNNRTFRLPTEAEWQHACGDTIDPQDLPTVAWFADNADDSPHPIAQKQPNKFGLYDMLGNVQEWCTAPDATGVTRGGSYRDPADKLTSTHREPNNRAWNASDPQLPKSKWWLADAPFVGFRVVCEVEDKRNEVTK